MLVSGSLVALGVLATASPAGATIDKNTIGCSGFANITPKNKPTFKVNATQSEVHLPREAGPVTYSGSTAITTHNHQGYVAVRLGPWKFKFYTWKSANDNNLKTDSGKKAYPSELKNVPPGKYYVTGAHTSPQGSCSGHMTIVIDGNPLTTPAGAGAAAGTIVFGGLTLLAGVARKVAL